MVIVSKFVSVISSTMFVAAKLQSDDSYAKRRSWARASARIASRLTPIMRHSQTTDRRQPLAALPRSNC